MSSKVKYMLLAAALSGAVHADLVHRYTFETTGGDAQVVDTVGSLNAAQINNATVNTNLTGQLHFRKEGLGALYMNGGAGAGESWIQFGNWDAGETFTMTWWMFRQSNQNPANNREWAMPLLATTSYGAKNGLLFFVNNHWGVDLEGRLTLTTGTSASTQTTKFTDDAVPDLSTYYHVALVIDGTAQTGTFYVDGVQVNSNAIYPDFSMGTGAWRVGSQWTDDTGSYKGFLDDIQIYNEALDGDDITYLEANPGSVIPEPATLGLVGFVTGGLLLFRRLFLIG